MSPSKRAGDTVEPDVDHSSDVDRSTDRGTPSSNGANGAPGHPNGSSKVDRGTSRPASTRPKRRSTPAAAAPPPERGSASQRGASSSSITRRSAVGAPAAADGHRDDPPLVTSSNGPTVDAPIVLPPAPIDTVEPSTPRSLEDRHAPVIVVPPLPALTPMSPPALRDMPIDGFTSDRLPPLDAPYVTTTMSSHQVAPVPRLVGRRPRVRKVTRVVRHVDPWSVFKVALVFNLVLYVVLLTAGVLLWNVAYATGTVDNLERFFESFGWSEFEFDGGAISTAVDRRSFGVVGLTRPLLAATLFNLITDLVAVQPDHRPGRWQSA